MFSRGLTSEERRLLRELESFVKEKHARLDEHDYAHVLQTKPLSVCLRDSALTSITLSPIVFGERFR